MFFFGWPTVVVHRGCNDRLLWLIKYVHNVHFFGWIVYLEAVLVFDHHHLYSAENRARLIDILSWIWTFIYGIQTACVVFLIPVYSLSDRPYTLWSLSIGVVHTQWSEYRMQNRIFLHSNMFSFLQLNAPLPCSLSLASPTKQIDANHATVLLQSWHGPRSLSQAVQDCRTDKDMALSQHGAVN